MLRDIKDLENAAISATDGLIGQVRDCFFDDDGWVIRYLVVEPGAWLTSRKVLISPISLHHPDWTTHMLPASITQQQVRNSPDIDTDKPLSREQETQTLRHYGYPNYWGGVSLWGDGLTPHATSADREPLDRPDQAVLRAERARSHSSTPQLRSCKAVTGFHIQASDGEIGHVAGYLIDDETWAVRFLIVDTSNWWIGHPTLIAPESITGVHWANRTVSVKLSRECVKHAPTYDPSMAWSLALDLSLDQPDSRMGPWTGSAGLETKV